MALAALLAVLLLSSAILAGGSSLHQLFHTTSSDAHACAICLLAQGHLDLPAVDPPLSAFHLTITFCAPLRETVFHPQTDRRLASSRAPPRSILPSFRR
jgi:hypothetical protein